MMRTLPTVIVVSLLVLRVPGGAAEPEKDQKTVKELYKEVGGPWRADDEKSALTAVWLHRNEKAPIPPQGKAAEWGVILTFVDRGTEGYDGAPEKVEADCDALKITLPPAGEGEKRGTSTLRLKRVGDKLEVRVTGGQFAGTYELKRVPSKQ
jgi:hypothetical protein